MITIAIKMIPTSAVGYGLSRYCQKIPQLVELNGLWEQEFLIAFHFKISSWFNKKWEIIFQIFKKKQFILESQTSMRLPTILICINPKMPTWKFCGVKSRNGSKVSGNTIRNSGKFSHFMFETNRFQSWKHRRTRRFTRNRKVGFIL